MVFPGENWIIWVVFVPVVHHLPASCRWKATHVSGGWFILTPLGRRLKMVSFWKEGPGCFYNGKIIVKSNFYCSASILLFFKNNFSQQQSQRNPGKSWRGWLFPSAAVKGPSAPRVAVAQTNEAPSAHFLFFISQSLEGKTRRLLVTQSIRSLNSCGNHTRFFWWSPISAGHQCYPTGGAAFLH